MEDIFIGRKTQRIFGQLTSAAICFAKFHDGLKKSLSDFSLSTYSCQLLNALLLNIRNVVLGRQLVELIHKRFFCLNETERSLNFENIVH